jgi:hypothetical protein
MSPTHSRRIKKVLSCFCGCCSRFSKIYSLAEGETNQRFREYKIIKPELEAEIKITKSCSDWVQQRSGKLTARRRQKVPSISASIGEGRVE